MRTALIAGCTGLIGNQLLNLLLKSPGYTTVKAITRRPLEIRHARLEVITSEIKSLPDHAARLAADDVFCCVGTTMKAAGSKAAFELVDLEYPLTLAKLAHAKGARHFGLVSALGADKNSSFYYNQIKGRAEEHLQSIPFRSIHIYRPSLLLGDRTESRPGEEAAKFVYKILNFVIPLKYRGIEGSSVAKAMMHYALHGAEGLHIHSSAELQQFSSK